MSVLTRWINRSRGPSRGGRDGRVRRIVATDETWRVLDGDVAAGRVVS